jgi:hypothetical protein
MPPSEREPTEKPLTDVWLRDASLLNGTDRIRCRPGQSTPKPHWTSNVFRRFDTLDTEKWTLGFFEFGGKAPLAYCKEDANANGSYWSCKRYIIDLYIDKQSLRFQVIQNGGYFEQGRAEQERQSDPEGYQQRQREIYEQYKLPDPIDEPDTPSIQIGKCSLL